MTIQSLRYVIEVANAKSFSRAARSLYVAQSALSAAVKDVENELGIQIFVRTNRGVTLTPVGEDCLKHCKEIVERTDYLMDRYKDGKDSFLYFSISSQRIPFVPKAFAELLQEIPAGTFDLALREVTTDQMLHDVSSGKSEIGIGVFYPEQLMLLEKNLMVYDLKFTKIATLYPYVFVGENNPLSQCDSLSADDLRDYVYVTYDTEFSPTFYGEENVDEKVFPRCVYVQDRATKVSLLRNSNAFSIGNALIDFSRCSDQDHNESFLKAVPFSGQTELPLLGYMSKKDVVLGSTARRFLEILDHHYITPTPHSKNGISDLEKMNV